MNTPSDLIREVVVRPAWDCEKVQPCVHGSKMCGTIPGSNHGRGTARVVFILGSYDDEVQLVMDTDWWCSETPTRIQAGRSGSFPLYGRAQMHYHSREQFDGSRPSTSPDDCPRTWIECHSMTDYLAGPTGGQLLVEQGSDALWAWLADRWQEKYELTSEEQK